MAPHQGADMGRGQHSVVGEESCSPSGKDPRGQAYWVGGRCVSWLPGGSEVVPGLPSDEPPRTAQFTVHSTAHPAICTASPMSPAFSGTPRDSCAL